MTLTKGTNERCDQVLNGLLDALIHAAVRCKKPVGYLSDPHKEDDANGDLLVQKFGNLSGQREQ